MPLVSDDPGYQHRLGYILGPWLVGAFVDVLLQGVLFCQFSNYLARYPNDKKPLRIAVFVLMILTTLKSIQCFGIIWFQNIVYFGDLNGAEQLPRTKWWHAGNPLMVAFLDAYVQSYFTYRLWTISKKRWVVVPVVTLLLFSLIAQVVMTHFIFAGDMTRVQHWFAIHLSTVFVGDVLMTSFSIYFLLKFRRESLRRTKRFFDQLILLTIQSAAPSAICAMLSLIFSQMWGLEGIIAVTFNTMVPKVYAVSMLYTLNSRRDLSTASERDISSVNTPTMQSWRERRNQDGLVFTSIADTMTKTHGEVGTTGQSLKQPTIEEPVAIV